VAIVSLLLAKVTVNPICDPALTLAASGALVMERSGGTVGVGVGVGANVALAVAVGVAVGLGVSVSVAVGLGVGVGVGVGELPRALTSIGRVRETVFPLLSVTVM